MRRAKGGKGLKSIDAALRTVRNNLGDHLKLAVKEFGKAELRGVRDQIHKRAPQQAQPLFGLLRADLEMAEPGRHRR